MRNAAWLVNRLKAMSLREVFWRIKQKHNHHLEFKKYFSLSLPVTEIPLSSELGSLHINPDMLLINWENDEWSLFHELDIFGKYYYDDYKNKWNAGFQTDNVWPEGDYSPDIKINQRDDIGDIRTNWELNRHYQFAALAKNYFCTKDEDHLDELLDLFQDWNKHNLFLHGVEWSSAMEIAIRVNSWLYAYAFLSRSGVDEDILNQLEHGILVMTDYISNHRARYSSANNHLIIEMYAVALVGLVTDYNSWRDDGLRVLTDELPRQNYSDGVNKEMSLHYQSFVMEAYGLLALVLKKNRMSIPDNWNIYLKSMTEFLADATGDYGETIEFGDNDEGKILDLVGNMENHYQYVLNLMSIILDARYTDEPLHENLRWIATPGLISQSYEKKKYTPLLVCSREESGYTFLRSKDRRVFIGIDHAELGFGSIAAHGHADALSFQMFVEGKPFLVDAGTYNYHVPSYKRNFFRSSHSHNTVTIKDTDQAEMLGPFLWGKRYRRNSVIVESSKDEVRISAEIMYEGIVHKRVFTFDFFNKLTVEDRVSCEKEASLILHLSPFANPELIDHSLDCDFAYIRSNNEMKLGMFEYSEKYNNICQSSMIEVRLGNKESAVLIETK